MGSVCRHRIPSKGTFVVLLLLALGCAGEKSGLRDVPVVFGDTPANDANALVGTWRTKDFRITPSGTISGRLDASRFRLSP